MLGVGGVFFTSEMRDLGKSSICGSLGLLVASCENYREALDGLEGMMGKFVRETIET